MHHESLMMRCCRVGILKKKPASSQEGWGIFLRRNCNLRHWKGCFAEAKTEPWGFSDFPLRAEKEEEPNHAIITLWTENFFYQCLHKTYKFPFNTTRKKGRFDLLFQHICSTFHIVQLSTSTCIVVAKVQLLFSVSTWTSRDYGGNS